jgi:hypothetical protein
MKKLNDKKWPEDMVVKVQPFTGKTYVDNIEVVYDPIDRCYIPIERPCYARNNYTEYDLRET